jgi:hypothetical protein
MRTKNATKTNPQKLKEKFSFHDNQGAKQKAIETGDLKLDQFGVLTTSGKNQFRYLFNNPTKIGKESIIGDFKEVTKEAKKEIENFEKS